MSLEEEVKEIKEIMDNEIRPHLKADGGDAEVVGVEDGVVTVELLGACSGCPMSQMTIKGMIEEQLKARLPEIDGVETAEAEAESSGFF